MTFVRSWLRLEVRRRWRSLTVLALLVALSAAVIMTSLAAARRGASTLTRLQERTQPATAYVLANKAGFDWGPIERLPEVEALSNFIVDYTLSVEGIDGNGVGFPFVDDNIMRTIEKPVIQKGRLPDLHRADEVLVTPKFVRTYHKGVGDTVVFELPSPKQLDDSFTGETLSKLDGPRVRARIVGVGVSLWFADSPDAPGGIAPSPGLAMKYPRETRGDPNAKGNTQFVNALVRLKHGEADLPRFRDELARVSGYSDIDVVDQIAMARTMQKHITFESRCLLAFGLAALVAALFLVGQAIARYAAASSAELQTMRALGMTPRQATVAATSGPLIVGVVGAAVGMLAAWVASDWFPYGTAKYFEPTPGRSWDWLVLGVGAVLVAVLVVAGAVIAAQLAVSAARRGVSGRRSTVATAVARSGAAVPVVVGTRFALESGRGRTSVPVRPALFGAVIGVIGIVAAFTFSRGVSDAANNPARFGQTFQLAAFVGINNGDFGPTDRIAAALAANHRTTGVDDARTAVATGQGGDVSVSLWEYDATPKPIPVAVLKGRLPSAADEVMLGPQTLSAMKAHVGDTVSLTGDRHRPVRLRVTGVGLVPEGPHNGYADGGWISRAGYDSVFEGFKFHVLLITVPHGTDLHSAASALVSEVGKAVPEAKGSLDIGPGDVPTEVAVIRQVRTLP
ncbi:MAG: putative transport system permease protein, partial [Pseudonocardiales bacterium]|nr:putative transport system permease protein [Pseudonocardiales bacterium]